MALKKRFRTALFGYQKDDVNRFLLEFNGSYEQMEEYYRDAMRTQATLLTRCDEDKKALTAKLAESDSLRERIVALEGELEGAQAQTAETEQLREALREKEEAYTALRESFDETVSAARSGIDEAQQVISAQSEKLAALEEALRAAQCENERLRTEAESAKAELETAKAEAESAKTEAESAKAELETAKAEAEKQEAEPSPAPEISNGEGQEILAEAKRQAAEIVAKAKQTAQLIRISALRGEAVPKPEEKPEKAASAALAPEDIKSGLAAMYGDSGE